MTQELFEQLRRDEGLRLERYTDSTGHLTIGYGHATGNIPECCTLEQAEQWLREDVAHAESQLEIHIPWVVKLNDARHGAIVAMAFNLGIIGLLKFHRTLTFIEDEKYDLAQQAMLHSLWAMQVGARAHRLSDQIRTGVWQ